MMKKHKVLVVLLGLVTILAVAALFLRTHIKRIENDVVRHYFSQTDYKSGDGSVIEQFVKKGDSRRDRPRAFVCKCPQGSGKMNLILKDVLSGEVFKKKVEGTDGSVRITNMQPGILYSYSLEQSDGGGRIGSGFFFTVGTVRMMDIEGIFNVRDIGGLRVEDGRTIRYGKIIRGSEMDGEHGVAITEKGVSELRDIVGIGFDLDLRQDDEVDLLDDEGKSINQADNPKSITASALGEDVGYTRVPITAYLEPWLTYGGANVRSKGTEEDSEPGDMDLTSGDAFNEDYESLSADKESGGDGEGLPLQVRMVERKKYDDAFRVIFDCVKKDIPIYIHCWGGADRTGTICYLLEGLLGVGESELAKDYEMTSFASKFGIRSIDSDEYRQMREYIAGGSRDLVTCEDFERLFEEMGFSQSEIVEFRKKMLE